MFSLKEISGEMKIMISSKVLFVSKLICFLFLMFMLKSVSYHEILQNKNSKCENKISTLPYCSLCNEIIKVSTQLFNIIFLPYFEQFIWYIFGHFTNYLFKFSCWNVCDERNVPNLNHEISKAQTSFNYFDKWLY